MKLYRLLAIALFGSSYLSAGFGNMSISSSTHDTTNPSKLKDITLSWAVPTTDGDTELNGYYYKLDQTTSTLMSSSNTNLAESATNKTSTASSGDGSYYFHIAPYAKDGDIGATAHFGPIKIDTTAPQSPTISPNDGGSFNSIQTIRMTSSDANNYSIYYTMDGTTVPTKDSDKYTDSIQLSSSKTIKAIAIDSAGNSSGVKTAPFTITLASNVAQFGSEVTQGATIATKSDGKSSKVIPVITVDGAEVTDYKYKVDTASFSSQTAKATPIDLTSLSSGTHTISIVGYDGSSWQSDNSATTLTFTVDNTSPEIVSFSTPTNSTITSNTTITLSSSDADKIYYTIDGSEPTTSSINSPTIPLTAINNGTITIKAIAYDKALNQSAVTESTYTVNIATTTSSGTSSSNTTSLGSGITNSIVTATASDVRTFSHFFGNGQSNEVVNISTHLPNAQEVTNSDGTTIVTASTNTNGKEIKNEIQVNSDGTLENSITVGTVVSTIEVNTIGADTVINSDGSMQITSTIPNGEGGTVVSDIKVDATGKMTNSISVTTAEGISKQTIIDSAIAGTDTIVSDDGSISMTTPTVDLSNGKKADFTISINSSGEVTPTVTVDGEDISIPQFDAGSTIHIEQVLDKLLLNIETILSKSITFYN